MPRASARTTLATAAVAALALAGCGSSDAPDEPADGSSSASDGAFPVTIEHALGTTTIEEEPVDVVTWGFGSTDAALALGVVPVAMPFQEYAGDEEGVLPWIAEALDGLGAQTPTVLPNTEEVPFEAIAAADPDVILANYSGLTAQDYALLTEIAPTVAYPDEAWATPWRDVVTTVGEALGKADEAQALVDETDATIAEAAAAHPELAGKSVAAVWDTEGSFYVYEQADPRVEFLSDLGLQVAPSVSELSTGESTFFYTLSYEELDKLSSDVLLLYSTTPDEAQSFLAAPYAQAMPQVRDGNVASVVGAQLISAVSPPTVLSLTWGLDDYLAALSAAVA